MKGKDDRMAIETLARAVIRPLVTSTILKEDGRSGTSLHAQHASRAEDAKLPALMRIKRTPLISAAHDA